MTTERIYGRGGLYLSRHKLLSTKWLRIFIHEFHRSDEDEELHSHPWDWGLSLILWGGYVETRVGSERKLRPGSLNLLRHHDYHRVELLGRKSWSLFIAGRKRRDWYFLNLGTGKRSHWRDFIIHKGLEPIKDR